MLHRLLCLLVERISAAASSPPSWCPGPHRQRAAALGTGNPGMANRPTSWEKVRWCWPETSPRPPWPGLCRLLFPTAGPIRPVGWLGAVLGHNFPSGGLPGRQGWPSPAPPLFSSPLSGDGRLSGRTGRHPALRLAAPGGGGDPRPVCPRPSCAAAEAGLLALILPDHALRHIWGLGRILRGDERKFRGR